MKVMNEQATKEAVAKLIKQLRCAIKYMTTSWQRGEAFGILFALKQFINDSEYEDLLKLYDSRSEQ